METSCGILPVNSNMVIPACFIIPRVVLYFKFYSGKICIISFDLRYLFMKITGIIAEYNPFHNGHFYHLHKARRETGADYLVVVMSGDFTQRGAPALADKFVRARMALACGADLVLELPVIHASGSAPYFARGAVALLDNLQAVDCLCFGSEEGSTDSLWEASRILKEEPPAFRQSLKKYLSMGHPFPSARQQALRDFPGSLPLTENLLHAPNNILGLEYCMALREFDSSIQPLAIARRESSYHQTHLGKQYSSATAVRQAIRQDEPFDRWSGHLPAPAAEILQEALQERGWIQENDFSLLLKYKCMETAPEDLSGFFDVSKEMASRIVNCLNDFTDYREFTARIKTREITYTRAARGLLHILLNLRQPEPPRSAAEWSPYARVLGFRKESACLLSHIKKTSRIPLVSRPAKFLKDGQSLNARARTMLEQDIHAGNLYESVLAYKGHTAFIHECRRPIERG